jgi:6-pyruvoyltetrahydropterin/6-carboxytetrahydropterin synthase
MFEICVEHTFAAGHALRNYRGKCENVHGHNYRVQVGLRGSELNDIGLLYDFAELKKHLRSISEHLDHQFINDLRPFDEINPSAENLAKFFYEEIEKQLQVPFIGYVRVWETDTAFAQYTR